MAFRAKRKFPRSERRDGIRIRTAVGLEYGTFDDLSVGGMKLFLDHPKEEGELFQLEFKTSGVKKLDIRTKARVVRCLPAGHGYEIGVAFVDLTSAARQEIEDFCEKFDTEDGPF